MRNLEILKLLARLINWLGFPGVVRAGEWRGKGVTAAIHVRLTAYYTIISVNGTDAYFDRLTGKYDGCGSSLDMPYTATPTADSPDGEKK